MTSVMNKLGYLITYYLYYQVSLISFQRFLIIVNEVLLIILMKFKLTIK